MDTENNTEQGLSRLPGIRQFSERRQRKERETDELEKEAVAKVVKLIRTQGVMTVHKRGLIAMNKSFTEFETLYSEQSYLLLQAKGNPGYYVTLVNNSGGSRQATLDIFSLPLHEGSQSLTFMKRLQDNGEIKRTKHGKVRNREQFLKGIMDAEVNAEGVKEMRENIQTRLKGTGARVENPLRYRSSPIKGDALDQTPFL